MMRWVMDNITNHYHWEHEEEDITALFENSITDLMALKGIYAARLKTTRKLLGILKATWLIIKGSKQDVYMEKHYTRHPVKIKKCIRYGTDSFDLENYDENTFQTNNDNESEDYRDLRETVKTYDYELYRFNLIAKVLECKITGNREDFTGLLFSRSYKKDIPNKGLLRVTFSIADDLIKTGDLEYGQDQSKMQNIIKETISKTYKNVTKKNLKSIDDYFYSKQIYLFTLNRKLYIGTSNKKMATECKLSNRMLKNEKDIYFNKY